MENEKLIGTFIAQCAEIAAKADKIAELAENHFDLGPESVNWGDVGNNAHTIELLDELLEFLHLRVDPREYES